MLTTTINLTAGSGTDEIVVQDQAGNNLPPANITWENVPAGLAATPAADGMGFTFSADTSMAAGTYSTGAIYSGPRAATPITGPTLTVNVTEPVTALQYDEVSGA